MRIRKSEHEKGMIGFFSEDENGGPDEFMSVYNIEIAQKIVKQLQKDIDIIVEQNKQEDGE